jgi:lysophospholipase L1-like esterase
VDDTLIESMVKPAPGLYQISGLSARKAHTVRIEVFSEIPRAPSEFGGFFAPKGVKKTGLGQRSRQMEFIGDSHNVGYGNRSAKRECTNDEVAATTDTSLAAGPITAKHYNADYQVNAISGRGIVRNFNGFPGDTLPQAYPFILLDKANTYNDPTWRPRVIAISLGTNDFATPLKAEERWKTRDELHADFETAYVSFVQSLRARNPDAFFLLWSIDWRDQESIVEVPKVVEQLTATGDRRVAFVPIRDLAMNGCHFHPSVDDDRKIAETLISFIDSHPEVWGTAVK